MAKIKQQIDDITKLIEENKKSDKERLRDINKRIKDYEQDFISFNKNKLGFENAIRKQKNLKLFSYKDKLKEDKQYNDLLLAKDILQDRVDKEEQKERLTTKKLEKTEQKELEEYASAELYDNLFEYFIKFKNNIVELKQVLLDYETIDEEIKKVASKYDIDGSNHFYYYLRRNYIKIFNSIYGLFKKNESEQIEKEKEEQARINRRYNNKVKFNVIATILNLGIAKISKDCRSRRGKRTSR